LRMRFGGMDSGVQGVGEVGPRATYVAGGRLEMHPWRTVGRAIPRSGCSPAGPASVSPGAATVTKAVGADKSKQTESRTVRFS
jgi:hypothetical protein